VVTAIAVTLGTWLILEVVVRLWVEWPLTTDFYGSISRDGVRDQQERYGVQVATGPGWAHLGWIADPQAERYRIEQQKEKIWQRLGGAEFGSYLTRESGCYRVWAEPRDGSPARLVGQVKVEVKRGGAPICVPRIDGQWRPLFRPVAAGDYVNDHCIYRDRNGNWRLVGITGKREGSYAEEKKFAVGVSSEFPPSGEMKEAPPVADFGEPAWAPHVIVESGTYYLFWSPHRLHRMTSSDGISWAQHRVVLKAPCHKFFRDAMIFNVAPGQWLLYSTARGQYFSRVDVYQSFDLAGWQYIGAAMRGRLGSERNAIVASMESPTVVSYRDHYYLFITYNNDSFFWPTALIPLKIWLGRRSYNETLVFHADNPYHFGVYRGRRWTSSLLTRLEAHAPEFVYSPAQDAWHITSAGWPWVATLTSGEVAVAPLRWDQFSDQTLGSKKHE
jgi:hypothetical protein